MAVDVGDEVKAPARQLVGLQRAHRHVRPQIGAADTDVDDVGDLRVGAYGLGKGQHGIQRGVHLLQGLGDEGLVTGQGQAPGAAQQGVQRGAALGAVDGLAGEHGVAAVLQPAGARHVQQQRLGLPVPQVLGQVGKHMGRLLAEMREARRVLGKGAPQIQDAAPGLVMALQQRPLRRLVATRVHGGVSAF